MNTEIIVHPKLQHYGLVTANMDAMVDWYRNVLGMTINHRSAVSTGAKERRALFGVRFRRQRRGPPSCRVL